VNFELGSEGQEAGRRVAALLAGEGKVFTALAGLDAVPLKQTLLSAQKALRGDGASSVAAGLAVARESVALLLAVEATRHLSGLVGSLGNQALPAAELVALSRGDRVGAVALADSAAASPARLTWSGGAWRLSCHKSFVTNAPLADWLAVFAECDGREAVCLVSPKDEGVHPGPPMDLMGLDGLAVASLVIDGAPLPREGVLGPFEDRAASARYARDANLSIAVAAAGLMRAVLRAANRHAHAHQRDGRAVSSRQEVSFKLAEVLAWTEAAELLCHRAAWMVATADPEGDTLVRCAKVFCTENAERAASACLQLTGGEGYLSGSLVERAYRDAKGLVLAGTTVEVARMAIADALLSRSASRVR
jgi:alkylation response protein AidB-like acyl-CoA dehydrogenase